MRSRGRSAGSGFATALAGFGLVELRQSGVRQNRHVVIVDGTGIGGLFGLVEHAILAFLALRGILPGQREPILLFERIKALDQLLDPGVTFGEAGFEFVDVCLGGPRQSGETGCQVLHDSKARRCTGLRRFVTADVTIVDRQHPRHRVSAREAVLSGRMATCRVDINAVEQQVKLLGREFDHGLLTTGPNEVAHFEPLMSPKPARS